MIIYSKKIIHFIETMTLRVKEILSEEVGLKVKNNRFYDRGMNFSYPIKIVIFNNKKMLGYFDRDFYEIGFHEALMMKSQKERDKIIRHEIAHLISIIEYPDMVDPHGFEFRAFCDRMGWGEEVFRKTACLENFEEITPQEESALLRKIQKLMALSSSNNKNEAESALMKSQELLSKHNIEGQYLKQDLDDLIVLKRVLKEKRISPKSSAIASILQTFFVSVVFSKGGEFTYLEILGTEVNVEIAEYVAQFLDREFELMWQDTRKKWPHLKGAVAKNSFFSGLAKGYCNKIQALKKAHSKEISTALIVLENQLEEAKAIVYPSLRTTRSSRTHCRESQFYGEMAGTKLNIKGAVGHKQTGQILIG